MQAQVMQMCLKIVGKIYWLFQMDVLIETTHGCRIQHALITTPHIKNGLIPMTGQMIEVV